MKLGNSWDKTLLCSSYGFQNISRYKRNWGKMENCNIQLEFQCIGNTKVSKKVYLAINVFILALFY